MDKFLARIAGPAQWILVGAGAVGFIVSFLPWYSVSFNGGKQFPGYSGSANAWSVGFGAWFPMLLLVAVAGVVVAIERGAIPNPIPGLMQWVTLGASGLAALIILIRWLTYPDLPGFAGSAGAGFGLYVGLLAALAAAAASFAVVRIGSQSRAFAAAEAHPPLPSV